MNKKICIFLGYSPKKTKIINKIKKKYIKSWEIKYIKKKISLKAAKESDLIISYGYRHIFTNSFLKKVSAPIINLHISFLPFNRGAHPNFWSFIDGTKSGVTIHKVEKKIDGGKILFRKEVKFNLGKLKRKLTFTKTYQILITEIEKLFLKNSHRIFKKKLKGFYPTTKGSFHRKKDLPKILKYWSQNIYDTKKLYHKNKIGN